MKTISIGVFAGISFLFCACGTPAIITSTWHEPTVPANTYNNIFVAAITTTPSDKKNIETDLQLDLQEKGLTVEKSMDVFPIKQGAEFGQRQSVQISKIKTMGADGILTLTLLRKDKEPVFEPLAPWEPVGQDYINSHADDFRIPGYRDNFQFDGFYRNDIVYYVETRFYNTKNELMVWSAESKTYDPNNIDQFVKGYVQTIYARLVKDGVIVANNNVRM